MKYEVNDSDLCYWYLYDKYMCYFLKSRHFKQLYDHLEVLETKGTPDTIWVKKFGKFCNKVMTKFFKE